MYATAYWYCQWETQMGGCEKKEDRVFIPQLLFAVWSIAVKEFFNSLGHSPGQVALLPSVCRAFCHG